MAKKVALVVLLVVLAAGVFTAGNSINPLFPWGTRWRVESVRPRVEERAGTYRHEVTPEAAVESVENLMELEESSLKSLFPEERAVLQMKYKLLEERGNVERSKARSMLREIRRIEKEEEKKRRVEQALS